MWGLGNGMKYLSHEDEAWIAEVEWLKNHPERLAAMADFQEEGVLMDKEMTLEEKQKHLEDAITNATSETWSKLGKVMADGLRARIKENRLSTLQEAVCEWVKELKSRDGVV